MEIKNYGDKVIIRTKPSLTIRAYQAEQALVVERPSSNVVTLNIDKGYYFNTVLDDVMRVQSDVNLLDLWAEDASEQLKITIDTAVLASIATNVAAANKGATAGRKSLNINLGATGAALTVVPRDPGTGEVEIMDLIVDLGTVLDEQNVPETDRWLVIPAWMAGLIKKSEIRNAATMGDATSVFRNGKIGTVDRFTVYVSNLLPTATDGDDTPTWIFAGHRHGLTFASQLTQTESLRAESTFGTLFRGLSVYGSMVTDGTMLTAAYVLKG